MPDRRSRHRSKCRIFADILTALSAGGEVRVTRILHDANMPHDRVMGYLDRMELSGLIERTGGSETEIDITPKGREYLIEFKKLEEFGAIFGVEI